MAHQIVDGARLVVHREAVDDGWGSLDEQPDPLRTTVQVDTARTVIAWNDSPDWSFVISCRAGGTPLRSRRGWPVLR